MTAGGGDQEYPEPEANPYEFQATHLQPSGLSRGTDYGLLMKDSSYNEYEFAEFAVSAGDVVQIGVNDGTKTLTFFTESSGGLLAAALQQPVNGKITTGWYSDSYEFHYGSIPLKTKTVGGKTHYYAEYTARHTGKLTTALKVNNNTTAGLGGAYVKINGAMK